jgi:hydrogenase maturation protease
MRILVLGIGNEILTDDGVGPRVVEEARKRWFGDGVCFETTFQAGMTLVDLITGYDTLIIVDALQTGGKPGELYRLTPEDMQIPNTAPVPEHRIGILRALELGRSLGLDMPERVEILAIEAADVTSFGEGLTPGVAASIPGAVREVLSLLTGLYSSYGASRQEP